MKQFAEKCMDSIREFWKKENLEQENTLIWKIVLITIPALMLAGMFLNFFLIDFREYIRDFPVAFATVIRTLSRYFGNESEQIGFSAFLLIRKGFTQSLEKGSLEASFLAMLRCTVLGAYSLAILELALAFFRNKAVDVIGMAAAAVGELLLIFVQIFSFSAGLYTEINGGLSKAANEFGGGFFSAFVSEILDQVLSLPAIRGLVFHSLGLAWWILIIGFLLCFILHLLGLIGKIKRKNQAIEREDRKAGAYAAQTEIAYREAYPGIYCLFGDLRGSFIPLSKGETIYIGSSRRCNLVFKNRGLDPVHLSIRVDMVRKEYIVSDLSGRGVWCEGLRLNRQENNRLSGGLTIYLGTRENRIMLAAF